MTDKPTSNFREVEYRRGRCEALDHIGAHDLIDWFVDSIGRMKSAFDPIISTYPPVTD